jgi:hypothetical protein
MLVSISFQFVGFLLTYLLHTTHAARLGSRAGLGVTLIQYGFALRGQRDGAPGSENADAWAGWKVGDATPTFETAAEAEAYYNQMNGTSMGLTEAEASVIVKNATTEWLSFFLMTVGTSFQFVPRQFNLSHVLRMVHPSDFSPRLLACQALGARDHDLPTGKCPSDINYRSTGKLCLRIAIRNDVRSSGYLP